MSVTDRQISWDDRIPAVDNAVLKDWVVSPHWGAIFAANDACFARPILRRTGELLVERGGNEGAADVQRAFCDAFDEIRTQHVVREYLRKFGISSVEQLRQEGPSKLGSKLFWSLARKIDNETLGDTSLLVYGYDPQQKMSAHIFEVTNPGNAFDLNHFQYYAIGSGATIATGVLNMRPLGILTPAQLIYRVCEAKFFAESASGVGRSTTVFIQNRNEPTTFLSEPTIGRLRELWERSRVEPPPEEVNKLITEVKWPWPGVY